MPKVKIPRKSTAVDMTAMCDVAFLLLSFFILATKQKPPEVLAVQTPNSVSSHVAPDKAIIVTLTKDGRTFLMLGDDTKKADILADIKRSRLWAFPMLICNVGKNRNSSVSHWA